MNSPLLAAEGTRHLLLGNEAVVRGALEAGLNFASCYPGTPSSEIPDNFRLLAPGGRFVFEYSTNEKVAMECAAGAALSGAMSLVTMKHVGLNVAADPLLTMTYTGLPGGLLIVSADDPGCHSSQNEQDNRIYARFAGLPCFEPANAQECKDMTREALLLSRASQQPVMLRTTTRIAHLRGPVLFGPLPDNPAPLVPFVRSPGRFVPIPAVARARHKVLAANIEEIRAGVEISPFNKTRGAGKNGIIVSGVSRAYLHDALLDNEKGLKIFELGMSWPLPEKALADFMRDLKVLLVLEEGEPLLERDLSALAHKLSLSVEIRGKEGPLGIFGEYSTRSIAQAAAALPGRQKQAEQNAPNKNLTALTDTDLASLPGRPPNLCPGCAHRSAFYAVRKVFGDEAYYSSDIGCYTLGILPPLKTADFLFCMGSSISAGSGFARFGKTVVAFIGDSTFFHSGMTGLVNAVFNRHNILVVILDNGTTAMTGHQPNPGMNQEVLGSGCVHVDIETVVKGCGVGRVAKVRGFNQKALTARLTEMKEETGVRVLIVEEPCVLYARRVLKKGREMRSSVARQDESVRKCFETLACPAFFRNETGMGINPDLCAGCMVCMQISPSFAAVKGEKP
ncbi:MAG: indolepyruvate ferredoxin oxidoreductase subunit alpha [Desulfovibrio sp.]|jgi:indolepyruvate ferredoxin oxidoreductase alpha subunit|nr:indolepyruvate ferredoxin oxidoreductase subunit alpha [Desulfovibrio sp.]